MWLLLQALGIGLTPQQAHSLLYDGFRQQVIIYLETGQCVSSLIWFKIVQINSLPFI